MYDGNPTLRLVATGLVLVCAAASASATEPCYVWNGGYGDYDFDGSVHCLAVYDGDLYAGGSFTQAGGQEAVGVARWNAATESWEALYPSLQLNNTNGDPVTVFAMAVYDDGEGPQLYLGGYFRRSQLWQVWSMIRWDGSSWDEVDKGVRLGETLTHGTVYALTVGDPNGDGYDALYVGGDFTHAQNIDEGGLTELNHVAKWDGQWAPVDSHDPPGLNSDVHALCVIDSPALGRMLSIGGYFSGTEDGTLTDLKRWANWDGVDYSCPWQWSTLDLGPGPSVRALAYYDDPCEGERLIIGGRFAVWEDSNIAFWNGSGIAALGDGTDGIVRTLAVFDADGPDPDDPPWLYVGGDFNTVYDHGDAEPASHVAQWACGYWRELRAGHQLYGGPDAENEGTGGQVYALLPRDDGQTFGRALLVGGGFTSAGDFPARRIASWEPGSLPEFVLEPVPAFSCPGGTVEFNALATGTEPLTYKWRTNAGGSWHDIEGATDPDLILYGVDPNDAGDYVCCVANQCDDYECTPTATLEIGHVGYMNGTWPESACEGEQVTFYNWVNANPPVDSHTWYLDDEVIQGATDRHYSIASVTAADEGWYYFEAHNQCGTGTRGPTYFEVFSAPTISQHPAGAELCEGGNVFFTVVGSGDPAPTYQWRKDGANIDGATTQILQLTGVTRDDAGQYDVVLANSCASLTSDAATLTVNYAPEITGQPGDRTVCAGEPATFSVTAVGAPGTGYQWYRDGFEIFDATEQVYTIDSVLPDDSGSTYHVEIWNDCGGPATSESATLMVETGVGCIDCTTDWSDAIGDPGMDAPVYALTSYDDGSGMMLYAGGDFTTAGDVPASYIAAWDGEEWYPLGELDGGVRALTPFDPDGGGPEMEALYVGGHFTTADGLTVNHVAKSESGPWSDLAGGLNGPVSSLAVFDDGLSGPLLYVGGQFTATADESVQLNNIAIWDGGAWSPVGDPNTAGDPNDQVHVLAALDPDGDGPEPTALYVGGSFETIDGVIVNNIAKWDGAVWLEIDGGLPDTPVHAIAVFDDGLTGPALYIGTDYSIHKWDGAWSEVGQGLNGPVLTLAAFDVDGDYPRLIAGGEFTHTGDELVELNHLAILDWGVWSEIDTGTDSWVRAAHVATIADATQLFIGGDFTQSGPMPSGFLAQWGC